jgi:hypothetical protein
MTDLRLSDYHHLGAVARKVGFTEEVDETSLALLSHRIHRYEFVLIGWEKKAKDVDKWGVQDLGTLLLPTQVSRNVEDVSTMNRSGFEK